MTINDLPNDIYTLKNLVLTKDIELNKKDQEIKRRDKLIINLEDALKLLRRKKFAPSSETSKEQLSLFNELEEIDAQNDIAEEESKSDDPEKKR